MDEVRICENRIGSMATMYPSIEQEADPFAFLTSHETYNIRILARRFR